jgi:hypothetical protein
MKKNIIISIGMIALLQLFSSCKKTYLDEKVYSAYAPETLADSLGLEASVVGLHNHLSTFFSYSDPRAGQVFGMQAQMLPLYRPLKSRVLKFPITITRS